MNEFDKLINKLDSLERLRERIKADVMIYQAETKRDAARYFNLPVFAFYDLPYEEWAAVRTRYWQAFEVGKAIALEQGIPMDCSWNQWYGFRVFMGLEGRT